MECVEKTFVWVYGDNYSRFGKKYEALFDEEINPNVELADETGCLTIVGPIPPHKDILTVKGPGHYKILGMVPAQPGATIGNFRIDHPVKKLDAFK
ncbi:hypothetical protein PL11_001950 [Lentilactobacillus curieae]|uniref:Uncharacterized protein n=1 Tax=Lentilactobacillus curieae TaxID=1138822 RepID=A0A1S6QGM2_9LACO|nr:hypothetical protein [Lentilactobacillus curieae]AQW20763.1 hypothetical protein PL11_001950 [Lentilactobacillus curieae]